MISDWTHLDIPHCLQTGHLAFENAYSHTMLLVPPTERHIPMQRALGADGLLPLRNYEAGMPDMHILQEAAFQFSKHITILDLLPLQYY